MKKSISIIVSVFLVLCLFAGCGSPTDVFVKSDKAKDSMVMEKGKVYKYDTFKFKLGEIKESKSNPKNKGESEGKWVTVELKLTGGDVSNEELEKLVKDEAVLLNGAAPLAQTLNATMNTSPFNGNKSSKLNNMSINLYYDVPGRFDVEQATVYYTDDVKEKSS